MDQDLRRLLEEIKELAEAAVVGAGSEIDILPIRNEIEDAENRLAGFVRENSESLTMRVESVDESVQRLHERVNEIAGTVEAIQAELPD